MKLTRTTTFHRCEKFYHHNGDPDVVSYMYPSCACGTCFVQDTTTCSKNIPALLRWSSNCRWNSTKRRFCNDLECWKYRMIRKSYQELHKEILPPHVYSNSNQETQWQLCGWHWCNISRLKPKVLQKRPSYNHSLEMKGAQLWDQLINATWNRRSHYTTQTSLLNTHMGRWHISTAIKGPIKQECNYPWSVWSYHRSTSNEQLPTQ